MLAAGTTPWLQVIPLPWEEMTLSLESWPNGWLAGSYEYDRFQLNEGDPPNADNATAWEEV